MPLSEFTVAIWMKPHRAYGYIAEIDASLVDDALPGGAFQSFKDIEKPQNSPQLLPEFPHRKFKVSAEQVRSLAQLADQINYAFAEHTFTPMLGGSFYGLRVSRGYQEASVVWQGRYEDQDESIRKLYAAVQALAEA
jgi:hypothetical protein